LTLRAFTIKNRFTVPFLETEMYLNFKTGLNRYSGLLEMAEGYGVLSKVGHRYALGDDILGFFKDFKDNVDIWEKQIMPKLEEVLQRELKFKNESEKTETVEMKDSDESI
jgi:hypothetical protein